MGPEAPSNQGVGQDQSHNVARSRYGLVRQVVFYSGGVGSQWTTPLGSSIAGAFGKGECLKKLPSHLGILKELSLSPGCTEANHACRAQFKYDGCLLLSL